MKRLNKVINVSLSGGIIGWLSSSPNSAISSAIKKANFDGWSVKQVIPAVSGNFAYSLLQALVLVFTLFLFTFENGFYIILEKELEDNLPIKKNCPFCREEINSDEAFCPNCGHKQN